MSDDTREHLLAQYEAHKKFAKRIQRREAKGKDTSDEVWEYPLAVEVVYHVVITLGTGGPHTELDVELDSGLDVRTVTWNGYWGGDVVTRHVYSDEPLYALAERYAELHVEDLREALAAMP